MEKPDFSNILPKEQLIPILKELENNTWIELKKGENVVEYLEKLSSLIAPQIGGLTLFFQNYNKGRKWPIFFYRIRATDEIKNRALRSEYSYPPSNIPSHQRANLPGYPVFYAADSPGTALFEVLRMDSYEHNIGKSYCLSVWEMSDEKGFIFSNLMYDGLPENSPFISFSKYPKDKEPKEFDEWFTNEQKEGFFELMKFYSRIFQNDTKYVISSFIAHQHLYNLKGPHGFRSDVLIYPSIQLDKNSLNFAIHPNFVDERLKLRTIYELEFKDVILRHEKPIGSDMTIKNFAVNDYGRIIWLSRNGSESLFQKRMSEELEGWVQMKK
ncbi:MAG: RES family NAD+ phosphorylase [Saprospiraceae bacterium]